MLDAYLRSRLISFLHAPAKRDATGNQLDGMCHGMQTAAIAPSAVCSTSCVLAQVDYKRIANGIMGIAPDDDDDDGLSAGRLDTRDSQNQAFAMLLTAARCVALQHRVTLPYAKFYRVQFTALNRQFVRP